MGRKVSCEEVNAFIVEYVDQQLDPELTAAFDRHIAKCACCTKFLQQYRTTLALVAETAEDPAMPDELVDETLAFLRQHIAASGDGAPA
ncbi:MAG: zf-HC2 domain-containing protein [Bacteroidota bacterium]